MFINCMICAEIQRNGSADWVFVVDVDEFLFPYCTHSPACKAESQISLCDTNQPTLFYRTVRDVLQAARYRVLDGHTHMTTYKAQKFEPCAYGWSYRMGNEKTLACAQVNGISLPSRFWVSGTAMALAAASEALSKVGKISTVSLTTTAASGLGVESLPAKRSKYIVHYGSINHINKTFEETVSRAQAWKTMHHVASSPPLTGFGTAHIGVGFNILSPRRQHTRGWTLEIAHLREEYSDQVIPMLLRDDGVSVLVERYRNCIGQI